MEIDNLYNEPFVVSVWAHAANERHRVHVFKNEKKWQVLIRFKPFEEVDAVSEGLDDMFRKFEFHYISRLDVQLFDGEAPSLRMNITNWDEILAAAKACIGNISTKISIIRCQRTKQRKREERGAAARANPPIPLFEFRGSPETMAQTRERQAAGEPLRNAEGRTEQEERDVYINARGPWVVPL